MTAMETFLTLVTVNSGTSIKTVISGVVSSKTMEGDTPGSPVYTVPEPSSALVASSPSLSVVTPGGFHQLNVCSFSRQTLAVMQITQIDHEIQSTTEKDYMKLALSCEFLQAPICNDQE